MTTRETLLRDLELWPEGHAEAMRLYAIEEAARPLVAVDPEADFVPDEDWDPAFLRLRDALGRTVEAIVERLEYDYVPMGDPYWHCRCPLLINRHHRVQVACAECGDRRPPGLFVG